MSGEMIWILCSGRPLTKREDRAVRMGRLRGHVDLHLLGGRVVVGHHAAGLDRGDVDARDVHLLLDDVMGLGKDLVGGVACLRLPNARCGWSCFSLSSRTMTLSSSASKGSTTGVQRLVVDVDHLDGIGGDVAVGGDDAQTSWAW